VEYLVTCAGVCRVHSLEVVEAVCVLVSSVRCTFGCAVPCLSVCAVLELWWAEGRRPLACRCVCVQYQDAYVIGLRLGKKTRLQKQCA